jgi:O-succinylbenzoic acid--CoA ligase
LKNPKFHKSFQLNGRSFSFSEEICVFSKTISESVFDFLSDWFSKEEFIMVSTSGATGIPKLIEVRKEFMKNSALATSEFFDLKENTTALMCLSPQYIAGKMMLVRALVLGWKLEMVAPSSNPLEHAINQYDFSAMVPLQLQNSLEHLNKIKTLIVGGGVVSKQLQKKLQQRSTNVYATYGMTETVTHIAIKKLNNFNRLPKESTSRDDYFKTLPGIKIAIDTRNCLCIDAPLISKEIIVTNDVVHIISENEFSWLGRFDHVINSGGIKLHPEIIEEKLALIIKQRFFVAGVPDEILGEKLVLVVEGQTPLYGIEKALKIEIKELASLSKFERPKHIYFTWPFIETATKKIQRNKTLKAVFNETRHK